jgi:hypothetical protein
MHVIKVLLMKWAWTLFEPKLQRVLSPKLRKFSPQT